MTPGAPEVAPPRPAVDVSGRLFVAVPLAEPMRAALRAHLARATGGRPVPGRRTPPESWHLTLRFLGATDAAAGARLVEALRGAALGPAFAMGFDGLGAFPQAGRAHVLWIGVDAGADTLRALADVVERAAVAAGFAREPRRFSAHLTLSRMRPAQDVRSILAAAPPAPPDRQVVDAVVLYRSHLARDGARYEAVARFPLTTRLDSEDA